MTDSEKIARFKLLTEQTLPALAKEHRWPIRLDHCFKRICLDHAFRDVWHHHISRPAQAHLTGPALDQALACAELVAQADCPTLDRLNRESLTYRHKIK